LDTIGLRNCAVSISLQLSAISFQLSAFSYQLSADSYEIDFGGLIPIFLLPPES
jgi:hypothetical protein